MPEIKLQNVSVELPLHNSKARSIKSAILAQAVGGRAVDDRDRSIVVVRARSDVTLHVEQGARIALIGGKWGWQDNATARRREDISADAGNRRHCGPRRMFNRSQRRDGHRSNRL